MELFCPGPVNIYKELQTKKYKEISHRGYDFQNLYIQCSNKTKQMFHDHANEYTPLFLTGSGTLAIESMIRSLKGKKRVLLLQNGFFAEKWALLFETHNIDFVSLSFEWGKPFSYDSIRNTVKKESIEAIFVVHHETSTTMINPLEPLNDLCKEYSLDLVVDGVSSVGMYPINVKNLSSLCMIGYSSNKCIGSYPGLAVVFAKTSYLQTLSTETSYLNLKLYYDFSLKSETPFTPCVLNFFYYNDALEKVLEQPMRYMDYTEHCRFLLQGLKNLNMEPCLKCQEFQCCWVVNVECPSPNELYDFLYKNQVVVYKCKGMLEKSSIQIAFFQKSKQEIKTLLSLIESFVATRKKEDPIATE